MASSSRPGLLAPSDHNPDCQLNSKGTKTTHSHDNHQPPQLFEPFQRLPIELRLVIWKYTCFESQKIIICRNNPRVNIRFSDRLVEWRREFLKWKTTSPNPGVRSANQETRKVFETFYKPLITFSTASQQIIRYFNPIIDTVSFGFASKERSQRIDSSNFSPGATQIIQRIELIDGTWDHDVPLFFAGLELESGNCMRALRHIPYIRPVVGLPAANNTQIQRDNSRYGKYLVNHYIYLQRNYDPTIFRPAITVQHDPVVEGFSSLGDTAGLGEAKSGNFTE